MADESKTLTLDSSKPKLRCIVKLGGAAITRKNELESIDDQNLSTVCSQLRTAMTPPEISPPVKVTGMDWSRRAGDSTFLDLDEMGNLDLGLDNNFIVVHGAGSFGHFQASRSGVHKGKLYLPLVKAGFVATRISVTSLNLEIVRALARVLLQKEYLLLEYHHLLVDGQLMKEMSGTALNCHLIASGDISQIAMALQAGFVPVLHGDAVLDHKQDCTILSGDVIIRHLAQLLMPEYVVFLTDVLGVYDRPPTDPNAILLREIAVGEDGDWSVAKPTLNHIKGKVEITVAAHDTTGGMETKILEAALIARLGIDVYITKAGTNHCQRALEGKVRDAPDDWLGTVIRFQQK